MTIQYIVDVEEKDGVTYYCFKFSFPVVWERQVRHSEIYHYTVYLEQLGHSIAPMTPPKTTNIVSFKSGGKISRCMAIEQLFAVAFSRVDLRNKFLQFLNAPQSLIIQNAPPRIFSQYRSNQPINHCYISNKLDYGFSSSITSINPMAKSSRISLLDLESVMRDLRDQETQMLKSFKCGFPDYPDVIPIQTTNQNILTDTLSSILSKVNIIKPKTQFVTLPERDHCIFPFHLTSCAIKDETIFVSANNCVKAISLVDGSIYDTPLVFEDDTITSVALSNHKNYLIAGTRGYEIRITNLENGDTKGAHIKNRFQDLHSEIVDINLNTWEGSSYIANLVFDESTQQLFVTSSRGALISVTVADILHFSGSYIQHHCSRTFGNISNPILPRTYLIDPVSWPIALGGNGEVFIGLNDKVYEYHQYQKLYTYCIYDILTCRWRRYNLTDSLDFYTKINTIDGEPFGNNKTKTILKAIDNTLTVQFNFPGLNSYVMTFAGDNSDDLLENWASNISSDNIYEHENKLNPSSQFEAIVSQELSMDTKVFSKKGSTDDPVVGFCDVTSGMEVAAIKESIYNSIPPEKFHKLATLCNVTTQDKAAKVKSYTDDSSAILPHAVAHGFAQIFACYSQPSQNTVKHIVVYKEHRIVAQGRNVIFWWKSVFVAYAWKVDSSDIVSLQLLPFSDEYLLAVVATANGVVHFELVYILLDHFYYTYIQASYSSAISAT